MPPGNKIPTHYEPGNAPPGRVAIGHAKPPRPGRPAKMQPQGRHTRHPSGPCARHALQNGPSDTAIWAVWHCDMARSATSDGPFCIMVRPGLQWRAAHTVGKRRRRCFIWI